MRIKKITSELGNDFRADMECEHCGHVQRLESGYHDGYYHKHVIPAITCASCKRNGHGLIPMEPNDEGRKYVGAQP